MPEPESPTAIAARFLDALGCGAFDDAAALVSPTVPADAMSTSRLAQVWAQLVGHLGPLGELHRPERTSTERGRRIADFGARFARSEVTLRVVLDDADRVVGFWATPPRPPAYDPPPYADPTRFREVETTVGAEPTLGATLTLPTAAAPGGWPAVVLVHGSGPNDRDERLGANRPFRDLAWGLATRGLAVLRYDKRTFAHPESLAGRPVTLDLEAIDDALAAVEVVRRVEGVDPARVVLVGHSLGATFAPTIALRSAALAGVVLLAPGARPMAEATLGQLEYLASLARASGTSTAELDAVRAVVADLGARRLPGDATVLGAPASYWYELDDRRPLDAARALRVPTLALFGGRDYQVMAADAALWRDALAGRGDATVRELPALDHLFREGTGTSTPADYLMRAGHVAAEVIDLVASWVASLGDGDAG
jgi:hypothetical protein